MSRPRTKTKIARTQLTLEADQKAELFRQARAHRISATALIERWIDEHAVQLAASNGAAALAVAGLPSKPLKPIAASPSGSTPERGTAAHPETGAQQSSQAKVPASPASSPSRRRKVA